MALTELTPEQREQALAKAREARQARSEALAELRTGKRTLSEFLTSDDEVLKRTRVRQVLRALPGIGDVRADRLMAVAKIDVKRRVGGLGSVQRATLLDELAA